MRLSIGVTAEPYAPPKKTKNSYAIDPADGWRSGTDGVACKPHPESGRFTMISMKTIATGLRFPEGPIAMDDGSVILVEIEARTLVRIGADGARSVIVELEGGPNGAALGPDGKVYVCNNGGFAWIEDEKGLRPHGAPQGDPVGWIERVDLATARVERLYEGEGPVKFRGPNDIVFDRSGGFWFTDAGKVNPRMVHRGGVYYGRIDGSALVEAIHPMWQANGIGLSPQEDRLYVAETVTGRLWAFELFRQ